MIDYTYLRPQKAQILKRFHNKRFELRDDLDVYVVKNAIILPLKTFPDDKLAWGRGGVVDEKGNYIRISSQGKLVNYGYSFDKVETINEKVCFCGYFRKHWGDFLIDSVSRLWYFLKNDKSVSKYVFFKEYGSGTEITGNYREFFELLGVWDKILVIDEPTYFPEIVIPQLSYCRWESYYSNYYLKMFETVSENALKQSGIDTNLLNIKKVYFTRSLFNKACSIEIGGDVLDNYFSQNGFEIVAPEKISLSEMIKIMNNSDVCASISGTLPHNMLFGKNGQKMIILERNPLNNEIQPDINLMKNLDVKYIDANLFVYPVELAYGPFIYGYNRQLQKFTNDNNYLPVDKKYTSPHHYKIILKKYFKLYKKEHYYKWYYDEWMEKYTNLMYEAYKDSMEYFGEWINGTRPIKLKHYFCIGYIKSVIRRIIKGR